MKENDALLKKINQVSSQYTAADFIKDWKHLRARLDVEKKRYIETNFEMFNIVCNKSLRNIYAHTHTHIFLYF